MVYKSFINNLLLITKITLLIKIISIIDNNERIDVMSGLNTKTIAMIP